MLVSMKRGPFMGRACAHPHGAGGRRHESWKCALAMLAPRVSVARRRSRWQLAQLGTARPAPRPMYLARRLSCALYDRSRHPQLLSYSSRYHSITVALITSISRLTAGGATTMGWAINSGPWREEGSYRRS